MAAGFVLARAAAGFDGISSNQKWLIYPVLIPVYVALGLFLIAGPGILAGAFAFEYFWYSARYAEAQVPVSAPNAMFWSAAIRAAVAVVLCSGIWLATVGIIAMRRPNWVKALFHPAANGFSRRHGKWIAAAGACLLLLFGIAFALVVA